MNTKPVYVYDLDLNLVKIFNTTQEFADYVNKEVQYIYYNMKYFKKFRFNNKWYILKRKPIAKD